MEGRYMILNLEFISWLILIIIAVFFGIWFFKYYVKDKDKRKLMFLIAYLLSSLSLLYKAILSIGYYNLESNLFMQNLFYWSSIPLLTAVLIATIESFFSIKRFSLLLKIFLVVTVFCIIMFFIPISVVDLIIYIYQIIAIVAITTLSYIYIIKRELSALLFLLALFSFTIAGFTMNTDLQHLSVFSFFIGFIFIGLVFVVSSKFEDSYKNSISYYFSLHKQLDYAKSALYESEEKLHSLLDNTPNTIMMVDQNGTILFLNRAVFNLIPEKVIGMSIYDIYDRKYQSVIMRNIERVFQTFESCRFETSRLNSDGGVDWYDVLIGPVKHYGRVFIATLISINITKQKLMEEKLEELLQLRNTNVEKLLKQKDDLIKQLAHDLKNPLNPLINLLPKIEDREKDPKSIEMLKVINRNVKYMKKLVINTIQLAQLNVIGSKFFFEDVNLFYEVNNVIEKNKIILDDSHMKINNNINKTIMVKVDKLRFEELFDNLVSNAIKYSPNGGIITVDAKEDKDFITISIKDSGIGMTTDQIDHIFDEFYRADKSQHDFNSSGLGLSICKRIVETLGGKIWVESLGVGKGSTFYFTVLKGCRINEDNVLMRKDKKLSYIEVKNVRKSYLGEYYSNYSYNSDSNKD
jgi:PAS domain S-box-containing protein